MASSECTSNPPTLNPTCGQGCVQEFGGLNTYITAAPESKLGILLVSDIFGYESPILRELADKVAASGFYVVVPDFFHGDPYVPNQKSIAEWKTAHGTDEAFEEARPVIEVIKKKGITKIGAAGFCWGAKIVVQLASSDDIQAAVILHPSLTTVDDIKEVKCPISMLGAEIDKASPPELLKQFEEILSAKPEVGSFLKIFPGCSHGWTMRYDLNDERAVKCAKEAHEDMLSWFVKYVK